MSSDEMATALTSLTKGQILDWEMHKDAYDEWEKEAAGSEGWWKSDTTDTLFGVFMNLVEIGMDADKAFGCLDRVISAMRSEYGE